MRREFIWAAMICVIAVVASAATGAPQLTLPWYTIDGGTMESARGRFELAGTIGQPDAAVMSRGRLTLSGGFRFQLVPTDCNDDGVVDLFDHALFEACLTGPGQGYQDPGCRCFDRDGDGDVDLGDNATLQRMFGL